MFSIDLKTQNQKSISAQVQPEQEKRTKQVSMTCVTQVVRDLKTQNPQSASAQVQPEQEKRTKQVYGTWVAQEARTLDLKKDLLGLAWHF